MCLAYPGKIIKIEKRKKALVDFKGLIKRIDVGLIGKPKVNDYVNVHAGFAIQKLAEKDAKKILKLYGKID